jgi:hypothetical protein
LRFNEVLIYTSIRRDGIILAKSISIYGLILKSGILPLINWKSDAATVGLTPFFTRKFSTSSIKQNKKSNLDNLLESFPSLSKKIHLYTTINIKECSQILLKMYNSLNDPIVKLYIQNNCLHLMYLERYTKEITPKDFKDYAVDGLDKQGHPSFYTGMSGCYAFFCLKTGDYYIGSAVCLNTRYKAHKLNSSRPERGGSNSLYLSVHKHGWHNFI